MLSRSINIVLLFFLINFFFILTILLIFLILFIIFIVFIFSCHLFFILFFFIFILLIRTTTVPILASLLMIIDFNTCIGAASMPWRGLFIHLETILSIIVSIILLRKQHALFWIDLLLIIVVNLVVMKWSFAAFLWVEGLFLD